MDAQSAPNLSGDDSGPDAAQAVPVDRLQLAGETGSARLAAAEAAGDVTTSLDLRNTLGRVVELARQVTGARYAACVVTGVSGLLHFVHAGLSPQEAAAIPHLPHGKGLLGEMLRRRESLRLERIADHPTAAGFPPNHPPMISFLGVPILYGDRNIGAIYLCDKQSGEPFTDADQETLGALARFASLAITNVRLREENRRLLWRLLRAQEEERRLAAYDLHDGPVQQLAAASMFLERAAIVLAASAPAEAAPVLARAREHVSAALARIRRIVAGLRPPDLDDAGLLGALEGLVAQQRERASAQIEFRHLGELPRLDPETETVLYHIAEEALSNAVRHSGADRITLLLEESGDTATLTIQDTGRGFSREADQPARDLGEHVGLSAMRERAEMLGGTFEIRTEPGEGTTVIVRMPMGRPS